MVWCVPIWKWGGGILTPQGEPRRPLAFHSAGSHLKAKWLESIWKGLWPEMHPGEVLGLGVPAELRVFIACLIVECLIGGSSKEKRRRSWGWCLKIWHLFCSWDDRAVLSVPIRFPHSSGHCILASRRRADSIWPGPACWLGRAFALSVYFICEPGVSDWLPKACDIETRKHRIKNKFLILKVKKTEGMGRERGESPHKMKKRRDGTCVIVMLWRYYHSNCMENWGLCSTYGN